MYHWEWDAHPSSDSIPDVQIMALFPPFVFQTYSVQGLEMLIGQNPLLVFLAVKSGDLLANTPISHLKSR